MACFIADTSHRLDAIDTPIGLRNGLTIVATIEATSVCTSEATVTIIWTHVILTTSNQNAPVATGDRTKSHTTVGTTVTTATGTTDMIPTSGLLGGGRRMMNVTTDPAEEVRPPMHAATTAQLGVRATIVVMRAPGTIPADEITGGILTRIVITGKAHRNLDAIE